MRVDLKNFQFSNEQTVERKGMKGHVIMAQCILFLTGWDLFEGPK